MKIFKDIEINAESIESKNLKYSIDPTDDMET